MPWLATHFNEGSPAAMSKSVFSSQMLTNLSNCFPLIELTGLRVFAVAAAAATAAVPVEVYCVCAYVVEMPSTAAKIVEKCMLNEGDIAGEKQQRSSSIWSGGHLALI